MADSELADLFRDVEIEWRTRWEIDDPIRTLFVDAVLANPDVVLRALGGELYVEHLSNVWWFPNRAEAE